MGATSINHYDDFYLLVEMNCIISFRLVLEIAVTIYRKKTVLILKLRQKKNGLKCTIIVSNGKGYLRTRIYWLKMTNNYQLWTLYGNQ